MEHLQRRLKSSMLGDGRGNDVCDDDDEGDYDDDEDDDDGSSFLLVSLQLWTSENQGDEGEAGDGEN